MPKNSFSEEEGEDEVIEIVRGKGTLKTYVSQRFDLVSYLGIWISVYDRYLVSLGVSIQLIVRMIGQTSIA